jgi:hypothetical protein
LNPRFLLALLLLPAVSFAAGGEGVNPHAFIDKPGACGRCHARVPVVAGGGFVKDIVSLCQECHFEQRMSHPVDIRPGRIPGLTLPLDGTRSITCSTCHDPHSPPFATIPYVRLPVLKRISRLFSGDQAYPTFFLRRPNSGGELCSLCHAPGTIGQEELLTGESAEKEYAGSDTCGECHLERHRAWKGTLHARTLQDPRKQPSAIVGKFEEGGRLAPRDVALVLGGHWTQRYLVDRGGKLMVAGEIWSVLDDRWGQPYWKEQDWERLCAGCHLTGWNPYARRFQERGVGCEACHGPGEEHARSGGEAPILNPGSLTADERDLICASCHTHGHDRTGEFRFPVGYIPGRDLARYYRGLIPKPGQTESTFKGDGSREDRLRSFRFWVGRYLLRQGVTCVLCKSFRAEDRVDQPAGDKPPEFMTLAESCIVCHRALREGDRNHSVFRIERSRCWECHPVMRDGKGDPSIHDHKFVFGGA